MHLHQRIHPQGFRQFPVLPECTIGQSIHDQEHRIGPHGPGFFDVVGIDHEVLSQYRQRHLSTGSDTAARAARRLASLPPKCLTSVSTLRQWAPACS